ncbi:parathyroid hormone/parathyroid hormone-related peptide receptor, partial [Elysia marginata]
EHMPRVKLMSTIGYSLSLTSLVLALTIMLYFKRLHCPRNLIHMNMFLAFGLRSALALMKNVLLVQDIGFANDVNQTGKEITFIEAGTHWECKLFFTVFYYIIFSSVMWLFNEGLYLQLILSVSVFAEKTKVRWFVLLGWEYGKSYSDKPRCVFCSACKAHDPLVVVSVQVLERARQGISVVDTTRTHGSIGGEMFGKCRISGEKRFGKGYRSTLPLPQHKPPTSLVKTVNTLCAQFRNVALKDLNEFTLKLAKSTLILIPLFAVYYMIFMWLPDDVSPEAELFKIYIEMLFNSFQGFLVAFLFCFINHEVQYEITKKWNRRVLRSGGTTVSLHSFFRHSTNHKDNNIRSTNNATSKPMGRSSRNHEFYLSDRTDERSTLSPLNKSPSHSHYSYGNATPTCV